MSYPGDPAGGQQQPGYPYSEGAGYPPNQGGFGPQPPVSGGGFAPPGGTPPPSGPPAPSSPYAPPGGPAPGSPAGGYNPDPSPYGGGYGYDPNTPPVSGMPISSPGMSSGLMSGPPLTHPLSGPPGGAPERRSPAVPIFAAAAVLFLLATAVFVVLYGTRNGDYNEQKRTVAARDKSIEGLNADIEKLKNDLKRVEAERDSAKRDLGGAQGQADELKRQKAVISKCLNLLGEAGTAARNGDNATADAKRKEADPVCEEAFRYLD